VAHGVVNAKKNEVNKSMFVSDDMPEFQALWETAADNVCELVDTDNKVMNNYLDFLIPTKHVISSCIIAHKSGSCNFEHACLLVCTIKSCCHELVCAAANHLPSITKKPSYCVSVHCLGADTLAL
jgi:hypothetical protein